MLSGSQCTLFVTFHIKEDRIDDFKAAHRPVWAACAQEPECLLFDIFQDPKQPGLFRFVKIWSGSREWFETKQLTKPYYEALWPKSRPTWEKEVDIENYEREGEGCIFRREYLSGRKCMD